MYRTLEPYASFATAIENVVTAATKIESNDHRTASLTPMQTAANDDAAAEREFRRIATSKMKAGIKMYQDGAYITILANMAGISADAAVEYLRLDPDVIFSGNYPQLKATLLTLE